MSTKLSENDIEFIKANTNFTREQILKWHSEFATNCPDGRIDRKEFNRFYKQLVPGDNSTFEKAEFCDAVFKAFDADSSGHIDFAEFLIAFWVSAAGSMKDKLNWLFDIYDADNGQYISLWEMNKMLTLLFSIKGISEDPYAKTNAIFGEFDRSRDGKISRQEFIAGCTRDETMRKLFAPY